MQPPMKDALSEKLRKSVLREDWATRFYDRFDEQQLWLMPVSIIGGLIALGASIVRSSPWPFACFVGAIIGLRFLNNLRIRRYERSGAMRARIALRDRALRIQQAERTFLLHCDQYEQWYLEVANGLRAPDDAAADRYHAFLARARSVLMCAIAQMDLIAKHQQEFLLNADIAPPNLACLLAEINPKAMEGLAAAVTPFDPTSHFRYEEAIEDALRELAEQDGRRVAITA